MTTKNRCIHKYLTVYKTTDNTHGLGDFLRGTITLFKYSQIYGYDLFIDYDDEMKEALLLFVTNNEKAFLNSLYK